MKPLLRRILPLPLKRALRTTQTLFQRTRSLSPQEGGLTRYILDRYCEGRGIEIGPGLDPYGPRDRTLLVDRLSLRKDSPTITDILADAARVPLADGYADYLISAHMLEHHPDPLRVLREWRRILRSGGRLVLILPHGERTYDRGREFSTLAHLEQVHGLPHDPNNPLNWADYERCSLSVPHHWFDKPEARNPDGTWNRRWLAEYGAIHYHVWTQHEMVEVLQSVGFKILAAFEELPERPDSFLVVGAKQSNGDDEALPQSTLPNPREVR